MIAAGLGLLLTMAAAAEPAVPVDAPAASPREQVTVQTRLSPSPSNVGDLLTYEVIVAFPRDITVNLPTQLDFSPLHLVAAEDAEAEATGTSLRKTFIITLQHFAPGEASVPAFDLTTVDASGAIHTVAVPAKPFEVEALLANEVDPVRKGEDDPVSVEYPNELAEFGIYAALGAIYLTVLLWGITRWVLRKPKVVVAPPPLPPHEVALSALDELERGELMQSEDLVPFYLQLTEIAKGYIEGRFGVPSLDRTTEEIRRELVRRADAIAPLSADDVIAFLQRSDLVKFARFAPEEDEAGEALAEVREMVARSTGAEAPPDGDVPPQTAAPAETDTPPQTEASQEPEAPKETEA